MAMREFTDGDGRHWKAWDIRPDELSANTKDENFLAALYLTGWIVFELQSGGNEKRRLYPIPQGWDELPEIELEVLLHKAERVPDRKLKLEQQSTGPDVNRAVQRAHKLHDAMVDTPDEVHDRVRDETPDVTDLSVVRTFRYPGGRIWTVCVAESLGRKRAFVLRFASGPRTIDLVDWPKDWADLPDGDLVELLRKAAPREPGAPVGDQRRRWDDAGQATSSPPR